jgi:hypothetical protein
MKIAPGPRSSSPVALAARCEIWILRRPTVQVPDFSQVNRIFSIILADCGITEGRPGEAAADLGTHRTGETRM